MTTASETRIRLAVTAGCLGVPLQRTAGACADLGAVGVQFDSQRELRPGDLSESGCRQFLHGLAERGISVASLAFAPRRPLFDRHDLDPTVAALREVLSFAYKLRARIVTARVGRLPENPEAPELTALQEVLDDLARHSDRVGSVLALTTSGESAETWTALLARVRSGPIGLDFDPGACAMSGRDSATTYRALHDRVLQIRARDGLLELDGSASEAALGEGAVDWPALLGSVAEAEYRGWIVVDRTGGSDRRGDAARGLGRLRHFLPGT